MAMKDEPIYFAPVKKLGGGWVAYKDSPSPPPAPDYAGAAVATAQGNADAARIAAKANRVSQFTPYGNLVYRQGGGLNQDAWNAAQKSYQDQLTKYNAAGGDSQQQFYSTPTSNPDGSIVNLGSIQTPNPNYIPKPVAPVEKDYVFGDPDTWTATVSLSPDQQKLLEQQNKTSLALAGLQDKGVSYVSDMLAKPFDQSKLPAQMINPGQTGQDAIMARLNPRFEQSENALRTRLANQGIAPGTEAWENEFRTFNEGKNDAYTQAALQGIGIGQQARQQGIQEQAFFRNEPLNTLNAVRTGAQVTNPTFTSVPQQQTTAGPDMLGAARAGYDAQLGAYNAQQAGGNSMMSGLFGLGAAAIMSPWAGKAFGFGVPAAV